MDAERMQRRGRTTTENAITKCIFKNIGISRPTTLDLNTTVTNTFYVFK